MYDQFVKYFSGELTSKESLELLQLVEKDESLKIEFIHLQNINSIYQLTPKPEDINEGKKSFKEFKSKMKIKTSKINFSNILKYSAVIAILIMSSVLTTLYINNKSIGETMNTLYVPAGQRARITLQDGTDVWLNAQSTLKYPSHFSKKERKVEISGEAFFDVKEESKRPFIVNTQHLNLEVLGTQFNIFSYENTNYVETILIEGSLKVSEKLNNSYSVILSPNEKLTFENNTFTVAPISNTDYLLWKNGIYSFENEKLIDIIKKLELYYDVTIKIEDPEIFNINYTGKIRQRDGIDEILRILQIIQPFDIEKDIENNIITLK